MEPDGLRVLGPLDPDARWGWCRWTSPAWTMPRPPSAWSGSSAYSARCGLHCAPLAHKTLGTFPQGTVRFSVDPLTRFEDIDYLQAAVCAVMGV